jgi:hypothetical protein
MAFMIPQFPPTTVRSKAEVRMFYRIRDELPNSWTALHSLGLGSHQRKPWAEIDFVLVGAAGVFCLEVKGGRVQRSNGVWIYVDGSEEGHPNAEGPFAQAGSASAALFKHLRAFLPSSAELLVGYGVVTPDFKFSVRGPDLVPDVVYDIGDTQASFATYMARLANYWHDRMLHRREPTLLGESAQASIKRHLRGDFDLEPCLQHQLGFVGEQLHRLTEEQYETVDGLIENPRVIVKGGPGTGKSLLALREARRFAAEGKRVLLCCFSDFLAGHLHTACDSPQLTISCLRSYMRRIVCSAGLEYRLPPAEEIDLDQVYYPQLSAEVALDWDESDRFDVLIVDEAQDVLRDTYLDFFDVALNGGLTEGSWRLFMDNNQDIYHNREPAALQRINKIGPTQFTLRINCRNTKPIAVATALLARVPLAETRVAEGPEVAYKWFTNFRHQSSLVASHINSLLSGGLNPDQITVLSAKSVAKSPWLRGLERVPFPLVQVDTAPKRSPKAIGFSSIKDFKGLESDAVILTDIDDLESDEFRELIYVGTSRARVFLSLFLSEQVRESFRNSGTALGKNLSREA